MQPRLVPDWRDAAAYVPLQGAERALFAWEWLRRNETYRAAAVARGTSNGRPRQFGLIAFEDPALGVPAARPVWARAVHPYVLRAVHSGQGRMDGRGDGLDMTGLASFVRCATVARTDHFLISDGLHSIRIDVPRGMLDRRCMPRFLLDGLTSAQAPLLALRRLIALSVGGRFASSLWRPEPRAKRWIMLLRAHDALACGATHREIAAELLRPDAALSGWRARDPSLRSQVQRLVRDARALLPEFRRLLRSPQSGGDPA